MTLQNCRTAILGCLMLVGTACGESVEQRRIGPPGDWSATQAVTVLDDSIYTVEKDGGLYRTAPDSGKRTRIGAADFENTEFLFSLGGGLFTIETDGNLYRVNPADGSWRRLGAKGEWFDTVAATVWAFGETEGILMTAESNGALVATSLGDGLRMRIGRPEFNNTRFMFFAGAWIYTIEADGSLYEVHPVNGSWRRVGPRETWLGTVAGTVLADLLFLARDDGALDVLAPWNGRSVRLAAEGFDRTKFMFVVAGAIYTIDSDGSLYRTEVDGSASESAPEVAAGAGRTLTESVGDARTTAAGIARSERQAASSDVAPPSAAGPLSHRSRLRKRGQPTPAGEQRKRRSK